MPKSFDVRTDSNNDDDFAVAYARTQRFSLGEPRQLRLFDTFGLFVRSDAGDDPTHHLWLVDLDDGTETKIVDAGQLGANGMTDRSAAEQAQRERLREGGAGIVSFATDTAGTTIAFSLGGSLYVTTVRSLREQTATHDESDDAGELAHTERLQVQGPVFDPRPSPDGTHIAFVADGVVHVVDRAAQTRLVLGDDDETISWGMAEFVAAEEMGRMRGYWWSPDSTALAVCRADVGEVEQWWIGDPATPEVPPRVHRYPRAGTANADVELFVVDLGRSPGSPSNTPQPIVWDRDEYPYLAAVHWADRLRLSVQRRDQRVVAYLVARPDGTTAPAFIDRDDDWVELVPGSGSDTYRGELVVAADRDGARRLLVGDQPVSPVSVQIRAILSIDPSGVLVTGNPTDDSTVQHLYRWTSLGFETLTAEPGVHRGTGTTDRFAIAVSTDAEPGTRWILPTGHRLASVAHRPPVRPVPTLLRTGTHDCVSAVLLPADHDGSPLPVLLDPYGGPHAQRAVRSYNSMTASQWFADRGFAVVITDGRGTPGRGTEFERSIRGDLATAALDDQIAGLYDAAETFEFLDLGRVGIRGWSFGGYLAALGVLRRPDVIHAAIAGAPVTEWRWYDTHYTERYLGMPEGSPDHYDRSSLLPIADRLQAPLMLIHGLADDNVVAAHSLQLSSALLSAGRSHELLALSGVSHMTPEPHVAGNLLMLQLEFLQRHLCAVGSS